MQVEIVDQLATMALGHEVGGYSCRAQLGSPVQISLEEAREIFDGVQQILARPQKLLGDRSTTVFRVKLQQQHGSSSTELHLSSSEMKVDNILEMLTSFPPAKQDEIKAAYVGYFNWAHALFKFAGQIADRFVHVI